MSFNVLIVDDSGAMRSVIRKIVSISGFHMDNCMEAGNGSEALDILSREWVDVIISDINMPVMSGLEMLSRLSRDELFKNIPVIMISTEGSEERIQESFALGAKGFIKKPFVPEDLKQKLHEIIGVQSDGQYEDDKEDISELDF